jgi:hypothetical protein
MPDLIEIIKVAKFVIISKAISVLIKIQPLSAPASFLKMDLF